MLAFIHFKKPIVVAVNGPALGLGASILPLCDVVWASEKAWFQTPCAALRLTPSGCSSYTFPQILGVALVSPAIVLGFSVKLFNRFFANVVLQSKMFAKMFLFFLFACFFLFHKS